MCRRATAVVVRGSCFLKTQSKEVVDGPEPAPFTDRAFQAVVPERGSYLTREADGYVRRSHRVYGEEREQQPHHMNLILCNRRDQSSARPRRVSTDWRRLRNAAFDR